MNQRDQTKPTKLNLEDQICQAKCLKGNKPNKIYQTELFIGAKTYLLDKRDQTKPTKLNLENQIYQAKCLKCNEPNIPNQIYSIKTTKLNPTNQFYQTKTKETKSTEN